MCPFQKNETLFELYSLVDLFNLDPSVHLFVRKENNFVLHGLGWNPSYICAESDSRIIYLIKRIHYHAKWTFYDVLYSLSGKGIFHWTAII